MNWINFLTNVFGIALGIVGGILAYYFFESRKKQADNEQQRRILKRELELNAKQIGGFLDELAKWTDAIKSGTLVNYLGYFPLTRMVSVTASRLLQSGYLYEILELDEIIQLQIMFGVYYVPSGENWINSQVLKHKSQYWDSQQNSNQKQWELFDKSSALQEVEVWKTTFSQDKKTLEAINTRLK